MKHNDVKESVHQRISTLSLKQIWEILKVSLVGRVHTDSCSSYSDNPDYISYFRVWRWLEMWFPIGFLQTHLSSDAHVGFQSRLKHRDKRRRWKCNQSGEERRFFISIIQVVAPVSLPQQPVQIGQDTNPIGSLADNNSTDSLPEKSDLRKKSDLPAVRTKPQWVTASVSFRPVCCILAAGSCLQRRKSPAANRRRWWPAGEHSGAFSS